MTEIEKIVKDMNEITVRLSAFIKTMEVEKQPKPVTDKKLARIKRKMELSNKLK